MRCEIFQVQAGREQRIEIELRYGELARDFFVAGENDADLATQLTIGAFGAERHANRLAIGIEPTAKIALMVGSQHEIRDAKISLRRGATNRSAAAEIEIELAADGKR